MVSYFLLGASSLKYRQTALVAVGQSFISLHPNLQSPVEGASRRTSLNLHNGYTENSTITLLRRLSRNLQAGAIWGVNTANTLE